MRARKADSAEGLFAFSERAGKRARGRKQGIDKRRSRLAQSVDMGLAGHAAVAAFLLGQSCIIAPTGEIVAMCSTAEDELVTAACDLACRPETQVANHLGNAERMQQAREEL